MIFLSRGAALQKFLILVRNWLISTTPPRLGFNPDQLEG